MTEPSASAHADPVVQQLVAACLDEADRFTRGVFDRACERHPDDARAIAHRYEALRRSGLVGSGPIGGPGPDPWEAGTREALSDPDAARQFDAIGPYQPLRELGRGGQAVVYLAEDLRLHRPVALKILKGLGPLSETVMNRFRREAEVASKLDHPGICAVFDAGVRDGVPYIAMRFVPGETLGDHVEAAKKRPRGGDDASASISVGSRTKNEIHRLLEIIERAARALHAAHEAGIVHRDVKPGNIMVTPQGDPVLLDFGLAGDEDQELMTLTETGDILGTPAYMSPEQLMAKRIRVDRRTDVYSLGVTLFECLTLERPYRAATREAMYQAIQFKHPTDIRSLNAGLPADVKVIVETALEKDRDKRYRTAADFADDLRRVREDEPIAARPVSALGRAWRWAKRRPFRAALAVALVLGVPVLTALAGHVVANRPAVLAAERQAKIDEIERHLEAGYGELAHGDANVALASFDAALAMDVSSGEGIGGKALALYRSREYDACLAFLDERADVEGGKWALRRIRIDTLRELGREGEADDEEKKTTAEPTTALGFFLAGAQLMQDCRKHHDKDVFRRAHAYFQRAALTAPHARRLYHFELAHAAGHLARENVARTTAASLQALWPDSPVAHRWAGFALEGVDPAAAVTAQQTEVELAPNEHGAWAKLGTALVRAGRLDEALAACRKALALNPADAQTLANVGHVLHRKGRLREALEACERAVETDGESEFAHNTLGVVRMAIGQSEAAIASCKKAIELNPHFGAAYHNLGSMYQALKRYDEAIEAFEKAMPLMPDTHEIPNNLGVALMRTGRYDEAIPYLERALEIAPDDPAPRYNLANALKLAGRLDEAIAACKKKIRVDADSADAYEELGRLLERKGDIASAIAAYRRAIELKWDFPLVLTRLGLLLERRGELDEAVIHYRRAAELKPGAPTLNDLGIALEELGRLEEAIEAFRKALVYEQNLNVLKNLDRAHRQNGEIQDALAVWQQAARTRPGHLVFKRLAIALRDNERFEESIAAFEKAIDASPKCWACPKELGDVFRRMGRFEDAIAQYRETLRLKPDYAGARNKLKRTEKLRALEPKLAGVLRGEIEPADADERDALGALAYYTQRYTAAAHLWQGVLEEDPQRAANLNAWLRHNAARVAVLVAAGKGKDAGTADAQERTEWRKKALGWLKDDLAAYERALEERTLKARVIRDRLVRWTWERTLRSVRGEKAVAGLPREEREGWTRLWTAVRALIDRTKATKAAKK